MNSNFWGLTAVNTYEDENRVGKLFAEETYQSSYISGLTFRTSWLDIEPEENKFDWGKLDAVFERAEKNKKWVHLIIVPGFATPEWALAGVHSETFKIKYGRGRGEERLLPLPWDEVYLSRWFNFLKKLSQRYSPMSSFRIISLAGPTSVSAEMSLPNSPEDLAKWKADGYTPQKYLRAWEKVVTTYGEIFPNQYFSLALYPGLPLDETGNRDRKEKDLARREIVEFGAKNFPQRFIIQTSGLNASKDVGAGYDLVKNYSGRLVTGFMMSTSATRNPAKMGDPQSPVNALRLSIKKGMDAKVNFLEIYEPDILNPSMQPLFGIGR